MDLESQGQPLSYEIAFSALALDDANTAIDEKGDTSEALVFRTQALAIIVLLTRYDSDSFHHNLIRSALWRQKFLQTLKDADIAQAYHQCASRTAGVHGALAAREFDVARNIIELTPNDFRPAMEYEDDYCIARLLHGLVVAGLSESEIEQFAERYASFDDEDSPRLRVLLALHQSDATEFHDAFRELIDMRADQIKADRKRGQLETGEVLAHREVFIEGLALLNLAERHGIRLEDEFLFCPPGARQVMAKAFPGV